MLLFWVKHYFGFVGNTIIEGVKTHQGKLTIALAFNSWLCELEENLVKALNHCRLENMKKLIEPLFFLELSNIGDNFFHI